jgi:alanyl-tRNA synthetase
MKANEIRKSFLEFFRGKDHKIVRSAPVIPIDDPTLLFTNAGMNQFKGIFLGTEKADSPRIADTQKCIRVSGKHNDLEEVGKDTYHHTFFEMLGNWSFGEYYKKEAIAWAWELLTEVWKMPKEKLWATIYLDDDEADEKWRSETDVNPDQILRFDKKDNFWEMGETGPCGPCSEIHIDLGPERCDRVADGDHVCEVNSGCARFIELWNLVFIQFNRNVNGDLEELPAKHVDTGMGFERVVAVMQDVVSNYDTDVFTPIIKSIDEITGVSYSSYSGVAHRVISDHIRALSFAIADGALPSNEGRGYVLRRLLRRAARYGRTINVLDPFIYKLVPVLADTMGKAFPELVEKNQHVAMVIKGEEESFGKTLDRGIEIFEKTADQLKANNEKIFPGTAVFQLYDTFGFPVDLTHLMAEEKDLELDMDGFDAEMEEQRRRGKEAHKFHFEAREFFKDGEEVENSEFVGYTELESTVKIVAYHDNEFLLDRTPFYGESGGQVGDHGIIRDKGGTFELRVVDAVKSGKRIVHFGEVIKGKIPSVVGKELTATVDSSLRKSAARNHTATHLLHKSLKMVLGEHVNQAGSLVAPDRLRFDFTHFEPISPDRLDRIEEIVNEQVRRNHQVEIHHLAFDEAKKRGAVALFGEKYGDVVRAVQIDDFSMELCGGTHLNSTGEIGYFRVTSEGGVAAGVRRIEAVTGEGSDQLLRKEKALLSELKEMSGAAEDDLVSRLEQLVDERRRLQKELDDLRLKSTAQELEPLLASPDSSNGFKLVATRVQADSVDGIKKLGDFVRSKLESGVGVLGAIINDKPFLLCVVTDDLIKTRSLRAGDIVKELAPQIGGGGGGRPHMAQAGGKDASRLDSAIANSANVIKNLIKK